MKSTSSSKSDVHHRSIHWVGDAEHEQRGERNLIMITIFGKKSVSVVMFVCVYV